MNVTGLCINEDGDHLGSNLTRLVDDFSFFQQCGYDGVELSIPGLDVIVGGRLRQSQVDRIRAVAERYPFIYTVHAPLRLNFAFPQKGPGGKPELHLEQDVFLACLDFCTAIGARVIVYHSGLIALHEAAFGLDHLPGDEVMEAARAQEVSALREMMPLAAERGVTVAMENRDPHPWEIATLWRAGLPDSQLLKYHSGMSIPELARQVSEVNHPNLGLTLDLAHLFIAARQSGFNYLEAIRQGAPIVRHLHGSDNFGRLGGVFDNMGERIPYGDGDLHLPPGWGAIPHVEALAQLADYEGLYVLEISPRYHEYLVEALQTIRRYIDEATSVSGS